MFRRISGWVLALIHPLEKNANFYNQFKVRTSPSVKQISQGIWFWCVLLFVWGGGLEEVWEVSEPTSSIFESIWSRRDLTNCILRIVLNQVVLCSPSFELSSSAYVRVWSIDSQYTAHRSPRYSSLDSGYRISVSVFWYHDHSFSQCHKYMMLITDSATILSIPDATWMVSEQWISFYSSGWAILTSW